MRSSGVMGVCILFQFKHMQMQDLWTLPRLWGRCGAHCRALARPTADPVSRELRNRRRHAAEGIFPIRLSHLATRGASVRTWSSIFGVMVRSEEHTSELQSQSNLVCRLLLEKKKKKKKKQ